MGDEENQRGGGGVKLKFFEEIKILENAWK